MAESYVITSGKGGVGKSTATANLGTALALLDQRVCLIDMDIGLRNLDVLLGLSNRIIYDIIDVVDGKVKLNKALVKDKRFKNNLYLLPAAQNTDKDALSPEDLKTIVNQLKEQFDFILIDCPAGIEQGFRNAVAGADGAVIVATPEISSVSDADRTVGLLEQYEMPFGTKLLINRMRPEMLEHGDVLSIEEMTQHLDVPLLGVVVDDEQLIRNANKGEPIVLNPKEASSKDYRDIARRLTGETVALREFSDDKHGLIYRLFHRK